MKIEVKNGSFSYKGADREVIENISFEAHTGDVLAILGPNGAGKTTLLRCLMGLIKWQSGQTLIDGEDINNIPQKKLWSKISYVPQAKQALAAYTVKEMVMLGRTSFVGTFSAPTKEDERKADEAIERMQLSSISHRKCSELSGGEFQMVLIARALVSEPEILVLDEPESNLDFKNQLLVLDTITKLSGEGMTVIFNTHYPAHALRRANKALMLSKSGEYRFGDVANIVNEESIDRYFGVKSVIGTVDSDDGIIRDVVPISITN